MSCVGGGGLSEVEKEQKKVDVQIEKQLEKLEKQDQGELKILLLGAGASGKSTIFKQMKILNMSGYTNDEKAEYKPLIHRNVYEIFVSMIEYCEEQVEQNEDEKYKIDGSYKEIVKKIVETMEETQTPMLASDMVAPLLELYQSDAMKLAYTKRNEFNLYDSAD
jgi:ABC-type sugar transport system ATPase subunit